MRKRTATTWVSALVACVVVAVVSVAAVAYVQRQQLPGDEGRFFELLQRSDWRSGVYDVSYGDIKAKVTVQDNNYAAQATLAGANVDMIVKDATVYFKLGSFESLYKAIGSEVSYQKLSEKLKTELKTFEKRWISIDLAMAKSQSPGIAKMHCGLALYEQLAKKNKEDWRELYALYKDQQFLEVKNNESSANVSVFTLAVNAEQVASFAKTYENAPQYKALKRCNNVSFADMKIPSDYTAKVTFDTKNTVVAGVELQPANEGKSKAIRVQPSSADPQVIAIPKQVVSYSEFVNGISTAVSP